MADEETRCESLDRFLPSDLVPLRIEPCCEDGLYYIGDTAILFGPCVAVAGSRKASAYGLAISDLVGKHAASEGAVLVCGVGGACAHAAARAALDAGGKVIIVAASGPDVAWPPDSKDIFDDAWGAGGLIVSRERFGSQATRSAVFARNRLIAHLGDVLIIPEAYLPSSTFAIAEIARGLGTEVCTFPGSIFSPSSAGSNALLADGATALFSEGDIGVRISEIVEAHRILWADDPFALPEDLELTEEFIRASSNQKPSPVRTPVQNPVQ